MFRAVQGSLPVTRVATAQAKKNETFELIQDANDCGLILDPAENILENPSAIFPECGSVDEEKMRVAVHSIGVVKAIKVVTLQEVGHIVFLQKLLMGLA